MSPLAQCNIFYCHNISYNICKSIAIYSIATIYPITFANQSYANDTDDF